ncbi:MAG: SGNH/GDSL hydrolase family protein [Deltaproteobacteria bacterium]|nr:SGNH/GDSL hydrolase family protein [bacterium]MCB9475944.1 SGNH/GDSL hydrolase family protein [Deltaproteobacteria bacterium]MCB9480129.1 SGNH/GDSL hydrolase family protein [Deltaproteobacteria bacterium]MCB9487994.1 SGNH/GDSL hydrolase family protein [Deltaproteobacteria bacterium]
MKRHRKRTRRWSWRKRAIAAVLGTLGALVLGEIIVGSIFKMNFELKAIMAPIPEDETIYRLKPNQELIFHGMMHDAPPTLVRTNAEGYRSSEDYAALKPGDGIRYLVFGDSYAFGSGVAENETLAADLKALIAPFVDRPLEVWNMGIPGFTGIQSMRLARMEAERYHADKIVLYFNHTDMAGRTLRYYGVAEWLNEHFSLARFFSYVLRPFVFANKKDVALGLRTAASELGKTTAAANITIVNGSKHKELDTILVEYGALAVHVADIHNDESNYLTPRDRHLSPEGYRKVATRVFNEMYRFDTDLFGTSTKSPSPKTDPAP